MIAKLSAVTLLFFILMVASIGLTILGEQIDKCPHEWGRVLLSLAATIGIVAAGLYVFLILFPGFNFAPLFEVIFSL